MSITLKALAIAGVTVLGLIPVANAFEPSGETGVARFEMTSGEAYEFPVFQGVVTPGDQFGEHCKRIDFPLDACLTAISLGNNIPNRGKLDTIQPGQSYWLPTAEAAVAFKAFIAGETSVLALGANETVDPAVAATAAMVEHMREQLGLQKYDDGFAAVGERLREFASQIDTNTLNIAAHDGLIADNVVAVAATQAEVESLSETVMYVASSLGDLRRNVPSGEDFAGALERVAALERGLEDFAFQLGETNLEQLESAVGEIDFTLGEIVEEFGQIRNRFAHIEGMEGRLDDLSNSLETARSEWARLDARIDALAERVTAAETLAGTANEKATDALAKAGTAEVTAAEARGVVEGLKGQVDRNAGALDGMRNWWWLIALIALIALVFSGLGYFRPRETQNNTVPAHDGPSRDEFNEHKENTNRRIDAVEAKANKALEGAKFATEIAMDGNGFEGELPTQADISDLDEGEMLEVVVRDTNGVRKVLQFELVMHQFDGDSRPARALQPHGIVNRRAPDNGIKPIKANRARLGKCITGAFKNHSLKGVETA